MRMARRRCRGSSRGAELRQAVYFSPQGYYKDMLYDVTLLENSATAQPLWHGGAEAVRRKEAVCVE